MPSYMNEMINHGNDEAVSFRARDVSKGFSAEKLDMIGDSGCSGFERDNDSLQPWKKRRANVRRLNAMLREPKNFPWIGASKACVPVINIAVHQFASRAAPEILPSKGVVNVRATGQEDVSRSLRVEFFMNDAIRRTRRYQEEMTNMLFQVALDGTCFRKVFYDEVNQQIAYKTISAADIVCNYAYTGDIRDCKRITHLLWLTPEELDERYEAGIYNKNAKGLKGGSVSGSESNVYEDPIRTTARHVEGVVVGNDHEEPGDNDPTPSDSPRLILEQHTYLKMRGKRRPVIITMDFETKKVLRIVSREYEEMGETKTQHFFVKYDFFGNSDGFYGFGLGSLLENYNALANALVNMLIDAGTDANTRKGLMSSKAGLDRGDLMWRPGEIKLYDGMVQDISKEFMLLPSSEPSQVLLTLLGMIQGWGKEIASVNDIMQGLDQAANQTATTTITLVEQGLKLFSAVHKRIRTSFQEELEMTYTLHRMYTSDEVYQSTIGNDGSDEYMMYMQAKAQHEQMVMQALPMIMVGYPIDLPPAPPHPFTIDQDFAPGYDIQPEADPEVVGQAQRLIVAKEMLTTTLQNPVTQMDVPVVRESLKRYYEAMGERDIEPLLPKPPPPPEPPQQQDQWIENAQFIRGDVSKPFVFETDNHAEHLLKMLDLFNDEAWEDMEPDRKAAAEQHRSEHQAYLYLQKKGMMSSEGTNAESNMAVQLPGGSYAGGAGVESVQGLGGSPGYEGLSPQIGPGEAVDNAPPSLQGRFPGLAAMAGS